MSAAALKKPHGATLEDLLALPNEGQGYEIIDGELVEKAATWEHGGAQFLFGNVLRAYNRRPGGRYPGGWWFATEQLAPCFPDRIYRPDVAGWRREKVRSEERRVG